MKLWIYANLILMALHYAPSHASAWVQISPEKDVLTVSATLYLYGNAANQDLVNSVVDEINLYWSGMTHTSSIPLPLWAGGARTKQKFEISVKGELISESLAQLMIRNHPAIGQNFIHIIAQPIDRTRPHSYIDKICGSTGTWMVTDQLGSSTTSAHEFGHALCLVHPYTSDLRGHGAPWMMVPRNSWVDSLYQINPHAKPGSIEGALNPLTRRVLQTDLDQIDWEDLVFDSNGRAPLGEPATLNLKENQPIE